jgi:hypothetical protein
MPAVMIPSEVAGAVREQHQTYLERCRLKGDRLCRRRQDRPAGSGIYSSVSQTTRDFDTQRI